MPSGAWQTTAPDCQGTGKVSVDTSVAYSGTRSLRVDGGAGYCNHVFAASTRDLSSVGPVVYVRMRFRHTTALPVNHVTFVSMPDASQGSKALRVGGQNGALQWNRESDDATLPGSFDDALRLVFEPSRDAPPANTLCALAAETPRGGRLKGLAAQILGAMRTIAGREGYRHLVAPVRPSMKTNLGRRMKPFRSM